MEKNLDCAGFLQWALPQLRLRWSGYRKVSRQVCRRLALRLEELHLPDFSAYQAYLNRHPGEWPVLDSRCGITISRFYRDRGVFDALRTRVLPSLADNALKAGEKEVRCWSAGCASGEEPYTLQIIWLTEVLPAIGQKISLRTIATDVNEKLLERGQRGRYPGSSLKDLPEPLRKAFVRQDDLYAIRQSFKPDIEFLKQDIRRRLPEGTFHLILCRNLVFTYFDEGLQRESLERMMAKMMPAGVLVIGRRETRPGGVAGLIPISDTAAIFQKQTASESL